MTSASVHPIAARDQIAGAQALLSELETLFAPVAVSPDQPAPTESADELAAFAGRSNTISAIEKLPGDASTRRYYRIQTKGGELPASLILSRVDPFSDPKEYLFLGMREHLERSGVDVPVVFGVSGANGLVLLEDLGDVTLLRRLQEVSSPDVERHLYEKVIDELIQLQLQASPRPGIGELQAFKLCFDHEKLTWEMNFAIEHFYEKHLGRQIAPQDLKTLQEGFSRICTYLAELPKVLAHRDFHSRNVMITSTSAGTPERLVMIDFQDARMGPAQYDLVSLLKDSYYQLEESQVVKLVDYYIVRWEALSGKRINRPEFMRAFDLMAVQRNFKAIGSFASFLNRRGNATYLKFIGNTFENIRRTLLKYPEFSELRETLFHYYYF